MSAGRPGRSGGHGLAGRAAVVTGAGDGLGRAIALKLASDGARVVANDVNGETLAETMRLLGDGHVGFVADLEDAEAPRGVVEAAVTGLGGVDILVNNAAVIVAGTVADTTDAQLDRVMNVNFRAPFQSIRAAVPHMLAAGGGVIVNIASISALVGLPEQAAYCSSKGALLQLTRSVAVDYAARGIRCNAVCPGTINTPLVRKFVDSAADPEAALRGLAEGHPAGRFAEPWEIADLVAFLASDSAAFINGAAISADGGYVAR